jgi:hypothetical protein
MAKPAAITIPTEPIGSIPRPVDLIQRVAKGDSEDPDIAPLYEEAMRDTIPRFEATGDSTRLFKYLPGGDLDSTHRPDIDYAELLPSLLVLGRW